MTPATTVAPPAVSGDPSSEPRADAVQAPRLVTSTEEIHSSIRKPGSVKINVQGAFIVDAESTTPQRTNSLGNGRGSPTHHETSDIRLPNHTGGVSHIAVDVSSIVLQNRKTMNVNGCANTLISDWRLAHQARLLFARASLDRPWWSTEFPALRNRPYR